MKKSKTYIGTMQKQRPCFYHLPMADLPEGQCNSKMAFADISIYYCGALKIYISKRNNTTPAQK
jgi:hypothetical protein